MEEDKFMDTDVTFGLIVRGDIDKIKGLKKMISEVDDIFLIYQKVSLNKLYIKEETLPSEVEDESTE